MRKAFLLTSGLIISNLFATSVLASSEEQSPWQVRFRAVNIMPDESANINPIGGSVDISNRIVPEMDISYFFTPNVAVELVLATAKHKVKAQGTSLGDVDLGTVWHLPPTLLLQYHFTPESQFSPYIGAGVNYTLFYNADSGAANDIDYGSSFGPALQVGMDYKLDKNWFLNVDLKKVWISPDVKINGGAIRADVDINPWIFGIGFGYRF
jgi:outer membrane protein